MKAEGERWGLWKNLFQIETPCPFPLANDNQTTPHDLGRSSHAPLSGV